MNTNANTTPATAADPDRVPLTDVMPKKGGAKPKGGKVKPSKDAARAEGAARMKAAADAKKDASAPKTQKPAKPAKEKKLSGLDAAAKVVASAKEPLNAQTIAERAIAAGWKTNGKTPYATLYAAIIREIAAKGKDSRFKKTERGLFVAGAKA